MKIICTYILKSLKDNKKYIGSTDNLIRRLEQHNKGYVQSTKNRLPFILIGYQECLSIQEAASFERKYKESHGALERGFKKGLVKTSGYGAIGSAFEWGSKG